MKKILVTLAAMLFLSAAGAAAEKKDNIIIPDYQCIINNSPVYYKDSVYPLISYKDITYFPMTYEYCRALGLVSQWVEGKGLYIAYTQASPEALPVYETQKNAKRGSAVIPEYPIYINGRLIDNKNTDYPLLNFRNVTYFPMTYDYAVNEFNWGTSWEPGKFALYSQARKYYTQMQVVKNNQSGALISVLEYYNVKDTDGDYVTARDVKYTWLDYGTGALSSAEEEDYDDYNRRDAELSFDEKSGTVYYGGAALDYSSEHAGSLNSGDYKKTSFSASGYMITKNGFDFLYVVERFSGVRQTGGEAIAYTTYAFLVYNGKPVFIDSRCDIENAAEVNGSVYIGARGYMQMVMRHPYSNSLLYRYNPDEDAAEPMTHSFEGFHSVKLLGAANGLLYLKCEWCPQPVWYDSYHDVSAANDGYFTYDGNDEHTLNKIANYRFANEELFAPNGDIYTITNWKGKIEKVIKCQ